MSARRGVHERESAILEREREGKRGEGEGGKERRGRGREGGREGGREYTDQPCWCTPEWDSLIDSTQRQSLTPKP
jgi:hypothetical protein